MFRERNTTREILRSSLMLAAAWPLVGCASLFGSSVPDAPRVNNASRCAFGASQTSVLVTEWPASEKANLESLMSGSAIAVEFSGCELRLLPQCRLQGSYMWQRTTPSSDRIEIENEMDLYTKLPLGAATLAGELDRSGALTIETTVSGHMRLQGMTAEQVTNTHECSRATHLIDGVALGVFTLGATGASSGKSSADVRGLTGGGGFSQSQRIVRQAGNKEACSAATDEAAANDCGSPIQVFLSPIPGRVEAAGPPGTLKVDFVSKSSDFRWDVFVDDQATCTTPCAKWVDPSRPIALRSRVGKQEVEVHGLETDQGPLQVAANPMRLGKLATGITFTALGGIAFITGVTLSGIGCSSDDGDGMCTAGIITGVVGGGVAAGGVYLILGSLAEVEVQPIFRTGPIVARIGPGYVRGRF